MRVSFLFKYKRGVFKMQLENFILAVIIGTLAAIVYSLRILLILERRVAGMEANIQKMTSQVLKEELKIEKKIIKKK